MSTTTYASPSLSSKNKAACNPNPNPPTPLQPLPAGFDSKLAYVLGLCCNSANDQYTAYVTNTPMNVNDPNDIKNWGIESVQPKPWNPDFSKILSQGYKPSPGHCNLSVYETDENGNSVEVPAGFIVRLDPTDESKCGMIVVTFHGTQNSYELDKIDNDMVPATFGGLFGNLGSVHGGFYAQYTNESNGNKGNLIARADGSLAKQIYDYFNESTDGTLSVKITGHSLGGALATLCALDIAFNFKSKFDSISMYSLASPRVADALAIDRASAAAFVSNYQQNVPDSYRVVNTLDPVPTLPPVLFPGPWITTNVCAHVLGDSDATPIEIAKPSPLDQNVVSFTDPNPPTQNGSNSPQECQGAHSCPAVYVPFLARLASAS